MPQFITESAATFYVQFTSFFPFVTLSSASLVAFCPSKMLQRPTRHLSREALAAGVFVVFLRHSPAASALRLTKSTLPQGREGTVAKCPSPPRGRRWPLGRMRGLSPAIQPLKSKIENQKHNPLTLALSPKGARGQSQNVLLPRGGEGGR